VRLKLDGIVARMAKGIAGSLRDSILNMFSNFANMAKKGIEGIIDTFASLSDYFAEFALTLMKQMFMLLRKVKSLVASEGYAISNIEVKIPSLKFEYVNMFQVSIPLPNIEPPEIRISLSDTTASKESNPSSPTTASKESNPSSPTTASKESNPSSPTTASKEPNPSDDDYFVVKDDE
jgi:hypothetical protein